MASPVFYLKNEMEAFPKGNTPSFTTTTIDEEFSSTVLLSGWGEGLSL